MTRIAFSMIGGPSWTGGYNYLINLLRVITQRHPGVLQPVLFFGSDIAEEEARPFQMIEGVEIVTSQRMNLGQRNSALLRSLLLGSDAETKREFQRHRIDVVFESAQFHGARLGIPAIAWIPDFQHRELPQLFSRAGWWKRELGFRAQIAGGRAIMLSSEDARRACERLYPSTVGRTHVVRFAVMSSERPAAQTVRDVREHHQLPDRYFFLPNQFWVHKNHLLVIDALALLRRAGHEVVVVASGKPFDPRRPTHHETIKRRIADEGLDLHFRHLGLVPYDHVAPLMSGSVAVINPSLFEGWSTTVEEARALNVPLILSDLDVHREQASEIATFFDRHSPQALADALLFMWNRPGDQTGRSGFAVALDPVQRFADNFVQLVKQVAVNPGNTKSTLK